MSRLERELLLAALLVGVLLAGAAAMPHPDEIAPDEDLEECPDLTDAVNPFSEDGWGEYTDCKTDEFEHDLRERLADHVRDVHETVADVRTELEDAIGAAIPV